MRFFAVIMASSFLLASSAMAEDKALSGTYIKKAGDYDSSFALMSTYFINNFINFFEKAFREVRLFRLPLLYILRSSPFPLFLVDPCHPFYTSNLPILLVSYMTTYPRM